MLVKILLIEEIEKIISNVASRNNTFSRRIHYILEDQIYSRAKGKKKLKILVCNLGLLRLYMSFIIYEL